MQSQLFRTNVTLLFYRRAIFQILNESFLPLIGEKKTRYECEMDMFEVG